MMTAASVTYLERDQEKGRLEAPKYGTRGPHVSEDHDEENGE